jgi:Holliday junction resolvase
LRLKARIDGNQKKIVEQLRRCGYAVLHLHQIGKGCPDIMVGANNRNFLFEIKDESKPKSQKKLTEHEEKFFQTWTGQVSVIESIEDAVHIIKSTQKNEEITTN